MNPVQEGREGAEEDLPEPPDEPPITAAALTWRWTSADPHEGQRTFSWSEGPRTSSSNRVSHSRHRKSYIGIFSHPSRASPG